MWAGVLAAACLLVLGLGCSGTPPVTPQAVAPKPTEQVPPVRLDERIGATTFRPGAPIRSIAVAAGTVFTCSEQALVAFDAASGVERQRVAQSCMRFALSPDGARLAVAGESELVLYEIRAGVLAADPVWAVPVPSVASQIHFRALAFAPDGRSISARVGFRDFFTFDVRSGKTLATRRRDTGFPDDELVGVHPTGRSVVLTSMRREPGTRIVPFGDGAATALAWPPNLHSVRSVSGPDAIFWSDDGAASGPTDTARPPAELVAAVGILDEPRDDVVCLWDAASGGLLASWVAPSSVRVLRFAPDGRSVWAATDAALLRLDVASRRVETIALRDAGESGRGEVQDLALAADGRFAFAGDSAGRIHRFDLVRAEDTTPETLSYQCAALSREGALGLVGNGRVVVRDPHGERALPTSLTGGTVRFSPDGNTLVVQDNAVELWSAHTSERLGRIEGDGFWPRVAVGADSAVYVLYTEWWLRRLGFGARAGVELPRIDLETPCMGGNFAHLALSADGTRLAVVNGGGYEQDLCASADPSLDGDNAHARPLSGAARLPYRLRIFDPASGSVLAARGVDGAQVPALALAPDGDVVALGGKSGIELWSSKTQRTLRHLAIDAELVLLEFVPGRPWLAVGSASGRVSIFDYERGELVTALDAHLGEIVCLSATATLLVTTGFEGTVASWTLAPAAPH